MQQSAEVGRRPRCASYTPGAGNPRRGGDLHDERRLTAEGRGRHFCRDGLKEPIVIYDREAGYARGLLLQLERMHFPVSECVVLTKKELLVQVLRRPVELLIANAEVQELLEGHEIRCTVLLTEGSSVREESRYPTVYKYQSMEHVMNEILTIYSEIGGDSITLNYTGGDAKKVIVVYSPSSGLSRSMFAMALAREYARTKETLYLPFEAFTAEQLADGRGGMSDLIYYLREQSGQIGLRIQTMAHKEGFLSYLSPVGHYLDVNEATGREFHYLVRELKENSPYEICVLEVGYFNHHVAQLMNLCDQIFLPFPQVAAEAEMPEGDRRIQAFQRALMTEGLPQVIPKLTKVPIPVGEVDWSRAEQVIRCVHDAALG